MVSNAVLAKAAQLIQTAMIVNASTKYAVFAKFSGHVHSLDCTVAEGKEDPKYVQYLLNEHVYIAEFPFVTEEEVIAKVEGWIAFLHGLMEVNSIDCPAIEASDAVPAANAELLA